MRIQLTDRKDGEWREWFAWHPATTDDGLCCWLEPVLRRWDQDRNFSIIDAYDSGAYDGGWQYKLIEQKEEEIS